MRFIVFRNVFIAFCALCIVWETMFLTGIPITADAFMLFIFSSTFFYYNFHSYSNHLAGKPFEKIFHLLDDNISLEQRLCVAIGFVFTAASFLFVSFKTQLYCVVFGLVSIGYSLPVFIIKGRQRRLREVSYVKIFTVSLMWALVTVMLPIIEYDHSIPNLLLVFIFVERILFIYAITIPFEIRDMEQEMKIGVMTVPAIHGIENSKRLGYILLLIFSMTSAAHQYYYPSDKNMALPMILSAIMSALLIYYTNDKQNKWYFKGLIDGTMIVQYYLLIIFNL